MLFHYFQSEFNQNLWRTQCPLKIPVFSMEFLCCLPFFCFWNSHWEHRSWEDICGGHILKGFKPKRMCLVYHNLVSSISNIVLDGYGPKVQFPPMNIDCIWSHRFYTNGQIPNQTHLISNLNTVWDSYWHVTNIINTSYVWRRSTLASLCWRTGSAWRPLLKEQSTVIRVLTAPLEWIQILSLVGIS